jgi:pyridoxal phosphate enzyme (YggS family)
MDDRFLDERSLHSNERLERLRVNLEAVKQRIASAEALADRQIGCVQLLAVTKYVSADAVLALAQLGQLDVGENYVQSALAKQELTLGQQALGQQAGDRVRWHLIGPLQSNKVRKVVGRFACIACVDHTELVTRIAQVSLERDHTQSVMIQVNTTGEGTKAGCAPAEALQLCKQVTTQAGLTLAGMFTLGPTQGGPEAATPAFRLLDQLAMCAEQQLGFSLVRSMGMSADLEVAIACGATQVRVGSAIFEGLAAWSSTKPTRKEAAH